MLGCMNLQPSKAKAKISANGSTKNTEKTASPPITIKAENISIGPTLLLKNFRNNIRMAVASRNASKKERMDCCVGKTSIIGNSWKNFKPTYRPSNCAAKNRDSWFASKFSFNLAIELFLSR